MTCKGIFRQVFNLSEAPLSYAFREKVRKAIVNKAGRNSNMTDCRMSSLWTLQNTSKDVFIVI